MRVEIRSAPASWASALINNDFSGLSLKESQEVLLWIAEQGMGYPVDAGDEYTGKFNGKMASLVDYSFLVNDKEA